MTRYATVPSVEMNRREYKIKVYGGFKIVFVLNKILRQSPLLG